MDLLFKRYASPFLLVDSLIENHSLNTFIEDMHEEVNKDKLWDFFLHKVYDKSWSEFLDETIPKKVEKVDLGATIKKSKNMLQNFTPERE